MGHEQSSLGLQDFVGSRPKPPFDALTRWPLCRVQSVISLVHRRPLGHLWSSADLAEAGLKWRDADVIVEAFGPSHPSRCRGADPLSLFGAVIVLSSLHRTTKLSYLFWLHDRRNCGTLLPPELVILVASTMRGLETALFPRGNGLMVPTTSTLAPMVIDACQHAQLADDRVDLVALLCACHRNAEITAVLATWDGGGVAVSEQVNEPVDVALNANDAACSVAEEPPQRVACALRAFDALALTLEASAPSVSSKQLLVHPAVTQSPHALERLKRAPASIGLVQFLDSLFPDASPVDIMRWWRWVQQNGASDELCFDQLCKNTARTPAASIQPHTARPESASGRAHSAQGRWSPLDSARSRHCRPPAVELTKNYSDPQHHPSAPSTARRNLPRRPASASAGRQLMVSSSTPRPPSAGGTARPPSAGGAASAGGSRRSSNAGTPSRASSRERNGARTFRGSSVSTAAATVQAYGRTTPRSTGGSTPRSGGVPCGRPPIRPELERRSPPIRC